jgi:putative transposase
LKSFDYRGVHRYYLTFCTFERQSLFTHSRDVEIVRSQIVRACTDLGFALVAYCFMPDHLHMLVEGTLDVSDCRKFIHRAKQLSAYQYKKPTGQRLWQRYEFERTLRDTEATTTVIRYIVENPVRAGLVKSPGDYPFLGSETHSRDALIELAQQGGKWSV